MDSRGIVVMAGFATLVCVLRAGAQEKQLTAREMFYAAPATAKPPVKEATPAQVASSGRTPSGTVAQSGSKAEPPKGPTEPGSKIITAAYTKRIPLGVRYSLLKRTDGGPGVEVDPGGVFRAGDRIRLSVEVNDAAYLYIVNRGSSGAWKVLFPSAEIEDGSNRVKPGQRYLIPAKDTYVFTFDEQPGVERLFVVLSRQPEADLENLIYSLSRRPGAAGTPAAPPVVTPPAEEKPSKMLLAQNLGPLGESLVGRLRNTYARDLIIEKVDESRPGPQKEYAVYVVNPTGTDDSRVVVDIELNHQ